MTHLLPSKSSTLKQKRLIKKYRDRSLRLLEKINPSEKRGVYHQSERGLRAPFIYLCNLSEYVGRFLLQRRSKQFHVLLTQVRQNRELRFRRLTQRSLNEVYLQLHQLG